MDQPSGGKNLNDEGDWDAFFGGGETNAVVNDTDVIEVCFLFVLL